MISVFNHPDYTIAQKQQATVQLKAGSQSILINNLASSVDMAPEIKLGKMFISVRTLTNDIWMITLDWEPTARKVTINSRYSTIVFWIGNNLAQIDGVLTPIDSNPKVVPYVKNGRSMLPIRFITDKLQAKSLVYDSKTQTATIVLEWFPNDLTFDWPTKGGNTQRQYWIPSAFELKSDDIILKQTSKTLPKIDRGMSSPLLVASDGLAYFCNGSNIFCYDPVINDVILLKSIDNSFELQDINIYNDKIVCASYKGVICLDRLAGKILWTKFDKDSSLSGSLYHGSMVNDQRIYRVSSTEIQCTNINDGSLIWRFESILKCEDCKPFYLTRNFIMEDKLMWIGYYNEFQNKIICINICGKVVWSEEFHNSCIPKIFIDGKLIVSEFEKGIVALEATSGKQLWWNYELVLDTSESDGNILITNINRDMAVYDQKLICQDKSKIYCVNNAEGYITWRADKNHQCNNITNFSFLVDSKRIYAYEKDVRNGFTSGFCENELGAKILIYEIKSGKFYKELVLDDKSNVTFLNAVIHKRNLYVIYCNLNEGKPLIQIYESKQ